MRSCSFPDAAELVVCLCSGSSDCASTRFLFLLLSLQTCSLVFINIGNIGILTVTPDKQPDHSKSSIQIP